LSFPLATEATVIHRPQLLADLQTVLRRLEADLLERSEEMAPVKEVLRGEHQRARTAERTAQSYEDWRSDYITQIAAAWVLSCVFVRFLEDNRLVDPPKIAGPGERLTRARDEHELYFRAHPTETDREYLLHVFADLARLPGTKDLFGAHNPIHELPAWLSGDAAGALLTFFQRIDANTGMLIHDFTDPDWNTRFLGDLYQDLSEAARKKYALLQTPEFVEEFILERTLEPALDAFGLSTCRLLDPTCGSGHFLLGAFQRILDRWLRTEPGTAVHELVQRTLNAVYGVDVNPYAMAITRFRLLMGALRASGITRLREAPGFRINVAVGDSLLHGRRFGELDLKDETIDLRRVGGSEHVYRAEDLIELNRILGQQYQVVVGNPPYITVKDQALNQAYRKRFSACHRQYSLAVPFTERFFELAVDGHETQMAGYVGMITANSFMKREFGKKLIEEFFPRIDLTHVIDTSGAYIPGHGTPTVILFGRHRKPISRKIHTVLGIQGEPTTPDDPAQGQVWSFILAQIDQPGSQSQFISVANTPRDSFYKHPWSIGGGGTSDLKIVIEANVQGALALKVESIGFGCITKQDDVFAQDHAALIRGGIGKSLIRPFGIGEDIRDWVHEASLWVIFPYDNNIQTLGPDLIPDILRYMWPWRTTLFDRKVFGGQTYREVGKPWYEYGQIPPERFRTPFSIAFAFVATHNHFVLDRGGKVFKQSAPIIKLPSDATEDDHLALLGLLNSSTACFWMKQVCHNKGATSDKGVLQADPEKFRYEFDSTKLARFPIPMLNPVQREAVLKLAKALDHSGRQLSEFTFKSVIATCLKSSGDLRKFLTNMCTERENLRNKMVCWQEELDWLCYELYGLLPSNSPARSHIWSVSCDDMPPVIADQRLYQLLDCLDEATRFTLVDQSRFETITRDLHIGLIERPEYKRRWFRSAGAYDDTNLDDQTLILRNLREWLLDRLESYFDFDGRMNAVGKPTAQIDLGLTATVRLADVARQDTDFLQVGELYCNDPAFDVLHLVAELVEAESVPLLPVLRYKDSGLRKRAAWEQTWDLQRQEDTLDARTKLAQSDPQYLTALQVQDLKYREIGDIPVPPKYTSNDFAINTYWRLRGKLDVPKERWVSFPHCEGADGTLVIAWAGYDHLQLARAISAYYVDIQERLGGRDDPRLVPLLACLIELLPWLKQWHNDVDPEFGMQMGDYFEGFVQEETRQMGKTLDQIMAWEPSKKTTRRRKQTMR
jgi:SAM-dependent methyltransferase